MNTTFCAIHKEISFSAPYMPSLMRDFFSKYTNSYAKEYKLYNELLDKTSLETEFLVSDSSEKDGPAPVPISHTLIPLIQNNFLTHSPSSALSYKSTFSHLL